MGVAVGAGTTRLVWVGWIVEIDVFQTGGASLVTRLSTDSNGILVVPINDDLVRFSNYLALRMNGELTL